MTHFLAQMEYKLVVLEGAETFCKDLCARYPDVQVFHSLAENFETELKFDNIVLGHVLEHVEDPVAILQKARTWLSEDGVILAAVPNARSLHRQAAVLMGLLSYEEDMNEADCIHVMDVCHTIIPFSVP